MQIYLLKCKFLIDQQRQENAWQHKEKMAECILISVISPSDNLVMPHVPNNGKRAPQEYQLHDSVVQ